MSRLKVLNITAAAATLLLSSLLVATAAQDACTSSSQPNPIAQQYADSVTGTLNTTLAIVPIPLDTARKLIPAQYAILEDAYHDLLPSFPADMYPVLMQAGLDHDIQLAAISYSLPDFQRAGWSFPFVDLLGDGFSSFIWAPAQMISADNEIAVNGSRAYGTIVFPATFDPACDAYGSKANGSVYFTGNATDSSGIYASLEFSALAQDTASPYPTTFFQNVTNQPIFGNGSLCDSQVRLFNSTLSQGQFAPVPVKGTIFSNLPPLDASAGVGDVFGVLIDTPFIEYNGLDCPSLQGYSGTGSGD
ncbi:hypothetical protein M406DRAFT_320628 [Cryphonectria parasitica EP155]|uniref:Uncharacterized protein n=1 Tax=Cryphonectria parasitica (strain ATCC 38755 / EP155) TaxID=660469 RepID=A0A9P4YDK7_CRYP1|nr:uncharacterized protein M406DRAFT_320628 [Cryphonectria parasitica EP155]KAF3771070.1 hypothetical protein M406DRAFT_320628 [Cryphonectria parasitica EP155]